MGSPTRPRPFLDSARRRRKPGNGVTNPRIIRLTAATVVAAPGAHPSSKSPRQELGDAAWTLDKTPSISVEPGRQETLDVPATSWPLEPGRDGLVLDDDEGGNRLDLEPFVQVRPLLLRHQHDLECAVVPAPLQYLREEAFHAAAVTGQARMEEDEPRLLRQWGDSHCHVAPPLVLEGRGLGPCLEQGDSCPECEVW